MNPSSTVPVLLGDIGGTNSRLKLISLSSDITIQPILIYQANLLSFNYSSFQHILESFLTSYKNTPNYPHIAVIGIPGALTSNKVLKSFRFPDLNGKTGEDYGKIFNMKQFIFLNDFNINGYGLQCDLMEGKDYVSLDNRVPLVNGNKAMIGAGTGLGMGYLTKVDQYYNVYSSEGGSQDFAPRTMLQQKYKEYIAKYYNIKTPTLEHCCSGSSISVMYKFFLEEQEEGKVEENQTIKDQFNKALGKQEEMIKLHEMIINTGIMNECNICKKVVDLFVELYASIASNYAISLLPLGGVYLLGGISGVLDNYIKTSTDFRKIFNDRNGLDDVLDQIPIYFVKNNQLGAKGAEEFARRLLEKL